MRFNVSGRTGVVCAAAFAGALAGAASSSGQTPVEKATVEKTPIEKATGDNTLDDVQIGEKGDRMRIALICAQSCPVVVDEDGFLIRGVTTSLEIDLAARSALASSLEIRPADGGSYLSLAGSRREAASYQSCTVNGLPASCIDIKFDGAAAPSQSVAAEPSDAPIIAVAEPMLDQLEQPSHVETPRRTSPAAERTALAGPPRPRRPVADPPPLREAPEREKLVLAGFEAPERLTPPGFEPAGSRQIIEDVYATDEPLPDTPFEADAPREPAAGVREASLTSPSEIAAPRASIIRREKAAALLGPDFDFTEQAAKILSKSLDPGSCEAARARLQADAWALDAMIDVGFCKAARGDLEAAEADLKRLLSYTPDNYEALVGRALIAAKAGEKSVARKYFQDALNALPPIEESNRIVEAMNAL